MLSAIAGSMICAGGVTRFERRQRQRDAVRDGERGDDQRQPPDRAAEQQQSDQEQQMVGPDQDVVDAGRHETCWTTARTPWRRAGEIFEPRLAAIEDRLRQRIALVDVDECLVDRIVGKQRGGHGDRSRRAIDGESGAEPQRLAIRQNFRRRPGPALSSVPSAATSSRAASSWMIASLRSDTTAGSSSRSIGSMLRSCATS